MVRNPLDVRDEIGVGLKYAENAGTCVRAGALFDMTKYIRIKQSPAVPISIVVFFFQRHIKNLTKLWWILATNLKIKPSWQKPVDLKFRAFSEKFDDLAEGKISVSGVLQLKMKDVKKDAVGHEQKTVSKNNIRTFLLSDKQSNWKFSGEIHKRRE